MATSVTARGAGSEAFVKGRRAYRLSEATVESVVLGGVFSAAYFALGYRVVIQQHVVVYDAVARLAHAFFVWYNAPPKLAAIGFVWAPISTLVFLPAAAIRPLATSLVALPLTTAVFTGALIALLNRILAFGGMSRPLRYPLVLAFAVNPMVAFYAVNGMSENVYLFLLVLGVYAIVKWFVDHESRWLVVAGITFSMASLTRYEMIAWALLLVAAIAAVLIRRRVSRVELEGSLIAYLAPVSYGIGVWVFVNWLILGRPFNWLANQAPGAGPQAPGAVGPTAAPPPGRVALDILSLNWHLFPPTLVVAAALVALFLRRRDLAALTLTGIILLNAVFTALLVELSKDEGVLQLRYNMRAMPLALVGVAWLYFTARGRTARLVTWAGALVLLVVSLPLTWHTMSTYRYQYQEQQFVRAISTGQDQRGKPTIDDPPPIGAPEIEMGQYVAANVHGRDAVLADDAQAFPVMLFSGRPDLFLDRIDKGDTEWRKVLDRPYGRVRYVLVSLLPRESRLDLVVQRYPQLLRGGLPGIVLAYRNARWALYRVAARQPPATVGSDGS